MLTFSNNTQTTLRFSGRYGQNWCLPGRFHLDLPLFHVFQQVDHLTAKCNGSEEPPESNACVVDVSHECALGRTGRGTQQKLSQSRLLELKGLHLMILHVDLESLLP